MKVTKEKPVTGGRTAVKNVKSLHPVAIGFHKQLKAPSVMPGFLIYAFTFAYDDRRALYVIPAASVDTNRYKKIKNG